MDITIKKYILFDLDGTVTNPGIGITNSVAYSLRSFGIAANPEELYGFIGPPLAKSFMDFYGFDENKAKLAVEKYREYYSVKGIYENFMYDGMKDLFQKLTASRKLPMLATSKPAFFARQVLEHFGIDRHFVFVAGSELDGSRVDKAEIIAYVLEQNNIRPFEAVMIGDRLHDIIGAKSNGIDSIGVLYGYGSRDELENAGADELAESVGALGKILLVGV